MPQVDFENWERENSFKSQRSLLTDADKEWANVDSEERRTEFLAKYQDVLTIEDGSLQPRIKIVTYQSIINRDGIYRTGDHFHKVIGDFIVSVKKEDYSMLATIKLTDGVPLEMSGVNVFQYTTPLEVDLKNTANSRNKVATLCPGGSGTLYIEDEEYNNPSGCRNDRTAYISARSFINLFTGYGDFNGTWRYGDFRQQAVETRVWGRIRNGYCNWSNYSTQLEWRSVTYTMNSPITTGYQADRTLFEYQYISKNVSNKDSGGDVPDIKEVTLFGDVQFNVPIAPIAFKYLYGEGKSRGVGDQWAVIYCP